MAIPATPHRRITQDLLAGTPAHQKQNENEVLSALVIELTTENDFHDDDTSEQTAEKITKHYQALQILVSECIVVLTDNKSGSSSGNGNEIISKANVDQVEKICLLIQNQIGKQPKLLVAVPSLGDTEDIQDQEEDLPFYRWILPRLIYTASVLYRKDEARQTAICLLDLAAWLVNQVGRYKEQHDRYIVKEGSAMVTDLVLGLSETCKVLSSKPSQTTLSFLIATTAKQARRNLYSSQHIGEQGILQRNDIPAFPLPSPNPSSRIFLSLSLIYTILRSAYSPSVISTSWREFCNASLSSLSTSIRQISFQLKSRMEAMGKDGASAVVQERGWMAVLGYGMLFLAVEPLLRDLEGLPRDLGNGIGQVVVEAALARLSGNGDEGEEEGRATMGKELDAQIVAGVQSLQKSFLGRLGGSYWSSIAQKLPGSISNPAMAELPGLQRKILLSLASSVLEPPAATDAHLASTISPEPLRHFSYYFEHVPSTSTSDRLSQRTRRTIELQKSFEKGEIRGTKRKAAEGSDQLANVQVASSQAQADAEAGEVMMEGVIETNSTADGQNGTQSAAGRKEKQKSWLLKVWRQVVRLLLGSEPEEMEDIPAWLMQFENSVQTSHVELPELMAKQLIDVMINEIVSQPVFKREDVVGVWLDDASKAFCTLAGCKGCDGKSSNIDASLVPPTYTPFGQDALTAWMHFARECYLQSLPGPVSDDVRVSLLTALRNLLRHGAARSANDFDPKRNKVMHQMLLEGIKSTSREVQRLTSQAIVGLVKIARANGSASLPRFGDILNEIQWVLDKAVMPMRATPICLLGELAKITEGDLFGAVITQLLVGQIIPPGSKTAFATVAPHLRQISIALVNGEYARLYEALPYLGNSRPSFIHSTTRYTLPHLVLTQNEAGITMVAEILGQTLLHLLLHGKTAVPRVFKVIFMQQQPAAVERTLTWLNELTGRSDRATLRTVANQHLRDVLLEIFVAMADPAEEKRTKDALHRFYLFIRGGNQSANSADVNEWLKQHLLGIMSGYSDLLHDVKGKISAQEKGQIVRSLSNLVQFIGVTIAAFSSQIMAILQTALFIKELRLDALRTWHTFFTVLRFADVGPHIGTTTACIVDQWQRMTMEERHSAKDTVKYLLIDNVQELMAWLGDVVSMREIPELQFASLKVEDIRSRWSARDRIEGLLKRCCSENVTLASHSLAELRDYLGKLGPQLSGLLQGDTFNDLAGQIYQTLISATSRDGDLADDLRMHSLQAIGVLGALDPDRFKMPNRDRPFMMGSNFQEVEEARDFAIHLIEKVLVGAYRTAHDAVQQGHLAYAIQELTRFCGFTAKLLQNSGSSVPVSNKVRQRWSNFSQNKQTLETVGPLIDGRFALDTGSNSKVFTYPLYTASSTYREWVRSWTDEMINIVLRQAQPIDPAQALGLSHAQTIFASFHPIVHKSQDVAVAHYLLPHLVLYVLIIGDQDARKMVVGEITAVLQDQVSPQGNQSADRRTLSAQAIFDLLDHLSRWLQEQRIALQLETRSRKDSVNPRTDKNYLLISDQIRTIDRMISDIDPELTAHAALQSKAFARSLQNFEQRITQLKDKGNRTDADLQDYYEYLHRIYADLDEPDGMEGVTTRVISPSLEHQIREHESVGRWTSAQSCWEVKLQQSPDDISLHLGLLRCLRSLGHYDTLRTHIDGVLSRHPSWQTELANFQVEAAWIVGDWIKVKEIVSVGATGSEVSMGRLLLAMHDRNHAEQPALFRHAREELGATIAASSRQYARAYPAIVQLHRLYEVEIIARAGTQIGLIHRQDGANREVQATHVANILRQTLHDRLELTLPSYRIRESILSIRRTAFAESPSSNAMLKAEVGAAWLTSAKIARKAGHAQTAYSASLQAKLYNATNVFFQQTKILKETGQPLKALTELENGLSMLKHELEAANRVIDLEGTDNYAADKSKQVSKAITLTARWAHETGRYDTNDIIARFQKAKNLAPRHESPYYRLGHYYDSLEGTIDKLTCQTFTVENYCKALRFGVKHIYQMLPRLLTLFLDLGEKVAEEEATKKKKNNASPETEAVRNLGVMSTAVEKARRNIPTYAWLTAFPQIVSRIGHNHSDVYAIISKIMRKVLSEYPRQTLWLMVGIYHANAGKSERALRCKKLFDTAKTEHPSITRYIEDAIIFSSQMLRLSLDPGVDASAAANVKDKRAKPPPHLSAAGQFPWLSSSWPTTMIVPTQDALTCTLPAGQANNRPHDPFSQGAVTIMRMRDQIDVMPSLQQPKKITFQGDDGKFYPFLVKPHDDLRKDARLMDFNSMINKLLKGKSETRKRNLYIRTYSVMPLNEECGMLEWVNNTVPFRNILIKQYESVDKRIFSSEIYQLLDAARAQGPQQSGKVFKENIAPRYQPCIFHRWLVLTWPEPTAWFAARLAFARTLAVMSMVGFILGLGDRHCENILFDSTTGDTVMVDFNCLFDKGKTFEIAERVPFRLTQNLVDGLGVTGVDGVFRRAAEIAIQLCRDNRDSLTCVLEAFVHDPLVEWQEAKKREERRNVRRQAGQAASDLRHFAEKALKPIRLKLSGAMGNESSSATIAPLSVVNQVEALIKEATNPVNLGSMYVGWSAYL